jgi:hypothetical protein
MTELAGAGFNSLVVHKAGAKAAKAHCRCPGPPPRKGAAKMTTTQYESIPHQIRATTWAGGSPAELEALIGAENVNVIPGGVQVRNVDGEWVTLGEGWAVSVGEDDNCRVLSPGAFKAGYREVSQ